MKISTLLGSFGVLAAATPILPIKPASRPGVGDLVAPQARGPLTFLEFVESTPREELAKLKDKANAFFGEAYEQSADSATVAHAVPEPAAAALSRRRANPSGEFIVWDCRPQSIDEGNGIVRKVDRCWVRDMKFDWWRVDFRYLSTINKHSTLMAAKNADALNRYVYYSRFVCDDEIIDEWTGVYTKKRCVEYRGVKDGEVKPEWDVGVEAIY